MVDTKDKKVWAVAVGLVAVMACSVYAGAGMLNTPVTNLVGDDSNNNTVDTPNLPVVDNNDSADNTLPLPPTPDNTNNPNDNGTDVTPTPIPTEHVNPNLYLSMIQDSNVQYGQPAYFTLESDAYGPNQPSEPTKVTTFIRITNVSNTSVEVFTYPDGAVPRLVNLYGDGQGGVYGILIGNWSTWDYSWQFENGKVMQNIQRFSVNMSASGDFKMTVYAIHDDGDGTYDVISNTVTKTFALSQKGLVDNYIMYGGNKDFVSTTYLYGTSTGFTVRVVRNGYVGTIHDYLFVSGQEGFNGVNIAGNYPTISSTNANWYVNNVGYITGTLYDLGTWDTGNSKDYIINIFPKDSTIYMQVNSMTDVGDNAACGIDLHTNY